MAEAKYTVALSQWADLIAAVVATLIFSLESIQDIVPPAWGMPVFITLAILRAFHERTHVAPVLKQAKAASVEAPATASSLSLVETTITDTDR